MAITNQAPYSPSRSTAAALDRYRDTGFGGRPIDSELIARMGFGAEIARRIVQTFRLLDLIGDDGKPSEVFEAFRKASNDDYKKLFASILYDQYAAVFDVMGRDLTGKTAEEIENHFRSFEPASLRKRMVTLFIGLCQYAAIIEGTAKVPSPARKVTPAKGKQTGAGRQDPPPPPYIPPPPPAITPLDDARKQYVELLLAKIESGETSAELLDRVERALGIAEAKAPDS